jgi:putative peptidoglycan lipid II flippase
VAKPGQRERTGGHAFLVAAGILLTRLIGFVRTYIFTGYFGLSDAADAFWAAFRIPNFLQTLFGEGVLSASFIPVYARLLAEKDDEEAGKVAGAVAALLAMTVSVIVLAGVLATPYIIDLIVGGLQGAKRELTIRLVRIFFPGAGILVMSAWCLGILNSHRKFFLSYTAPVAWNLVMIGALLVFGGRLANLSSLAVAVAWASVAGSALQFGVQLPSVLALVRRLRVRWDAESAHVREVVRNFLPVFISRGVVQISAYVDIWLAGYLPTAAISGLSLTQQVYTLPVSLFGMAVSAAELPAMSSALGEPAEVAEYLRDRLNRGLRQIAFFIVPSAMGFLALGDVISGVLFQHRKFTHDDSLYVWGILAGSAVGLLASTLGRLYSSTYYALRDTRTPLRYAVLRVVLTTGLGYVCSQWLPVWIGIEARWGVAGLTASAGVSGWVEFVLLRRTLNARIGRTGLPAELAARLWLAAATGAAVAWGVKLGIGTQKPLLMGIAILLPYGLAYFGAAYLLRIEECTQALRRLRRR